MIYFAMSHFNCIWELKLLRHPPRPPARPLLRNDFVGTLTSWALCLWMIFFPFNLQAMPQYKSAVLGYNCLLCLLPLCLAQCGNQSEFPGEPQLQLLLALHPWRHLGHLPPGSQASWIFSYSRKCFQTWRRNKQCWNKKRGCLSLKGGEEMWGNAFFSQLA